MPTATDYFTKVGSPGTASTLAAPGHTIGGATFNVVSTSNWPTTTGVIFAVDTFTTQIVNGVSTAVRTPGSYTEWEGVVASSTQITGATLLYGTDQNYSAGASTRVYIPVASSRENRLVDGLIAAGLTQAGGMGAISPTSVTSSGTITAANFVQTGGASSNGWTVGLTVPNTVTALGNRSYSLVVNSTDLTTQVSPGMRLKFTRTVAAPTQCTSLNGTTQYYSKSSPSGMTGTNNYVAGGWFKITAYGAQGLISKWTSAAGGWRLILSASGQVQMDGFNGGNVNSKTLTSYQSVPLNKWFHVAAQLDMTVTTNTSTTNYVMIDGVDVPAVVTTGGTNPTAWTNSGVLEVGAQNAGQTPLIGKAAQVFVYGAKVTQANILLTISQGLAGTETSLISAYSFNNSINDLNANANNLTANGSAVATNADSPFGGQAGGTISSTLDYGIIQSATFSTNTTLVVQVPEGCTIPTSGGVSAVSYSSVKAPYGFPAQRSKWKVNYILRTQLSVASNVTFAAMAGLSFVTPAGEWTVGYDLGLYNLVTTLVYWNLNNVAQTGLTATTSDLSMQCSINNVNNTGTFTMQSLVQSEFSLSTSSTFVLYTQGATTSAGLFAANTNCELFAVNALL